MHRGIGQRMRFRLFFVKVWEIYNRVEIPDLGCPECAEPIIFAENPHPRFVYIRSISDFMDISEISVLTGFSYLWSRILNARRRDIERILMRSSSKDHGG